MTQPLQDQERAAATARTGGSDPRRQPAGPADGRRRGGPPPGSRPAGPRSGGNESGAPGPSNGHDPLREQDPVPTSDWIIPTPADLAEYEQIKSGMAERVLALAEREARFRWAAESDAEQGTALDRHAQLFALVIIVLFFAAAVYLIGSGKQVAGCILGVVDLIALISVFATSGRLGKR